VGGGEFWRHSLAGIGLLITCSKGSTLACAGVTAWNALDGLKNVPKGAAALLQGHFPHWTSLKSLADNDSGTGGVSIFALLLCVAAGIRPIITSSSDEKLKALQELYPEVRGINYKTVSDQSAEIKRLTDGRGVDFVINNTGPQSIIEDISFLCGRGGSVALVGFLHGLTADWQPGMIMSLMSKAAKVK
jgi:NADPH:quinone reductase-like Zn-dependent oxidoreductase